MGFITSALMEEQKITSVEKNESKLYLRWEPHPPVFRQRNYGFRSTIYSNTILHSIGINKCFLIQKAIFSDEDKNVSSFLTWWRLDVLSQCFGMCVRINIGINIRHPLKLVLKNFRHMILQKVHSYTSTVCWNLIIWEV